MEKKGRIFSGMRPTADRPHLGNYLGALDNWVKLQEEYECFFSIVDLHALTTGYEDTSRLQNNMRQMAIDWISAGLDPEKCCIFRQSQVPQHAELHLLLSMITPLSWLERCPTYKEQLRQLETRDISTYGFLGYPVLMTADILLYQATTVPVGEDQVPHIELAREIARRFNHFYGETFCVPQAKLTKFAVLPGIDGRKMSKSYDNYIPMSASGEEINAKVKMMITDPQRVRRNDPGNPDVCTVYTFQKLFNSEIIEEISEGCRTGAVGCKDCKERLGHCLTQLLAPIRSKREELENTPEVVEQILAKGAEKAREVAERNLSQIKKAMRL